jgi:hypothetical protein
LIDSVEAKLRDSDTRSNHGREEYCDKCQATRDLLLSHL